MNTASPSRIATVIVSYNVRDLLRQCLASVIDAELRSRIIVVDNASHDGSVTMIRREFPSVHLIANDTNRGFAAATNQGIRAALDLDPGLEGAWHFPNLWMTFFDLFPPRGPLLGRLYTSPLNGRYREERGAEPFPIDHPLGAAMLMRRAAIDELGLLDEGYWMYVEEVDWCYRCRRAGWSIWQVPQAEVVHAAGASSQQFKGRSFVALHRSRLRFFGRHFGAGYAAWNRRIVRAGMLWATLAAWREHWRGRLGIDELRRRLLAYGQVLRLARGDR
jgi:N-acetylglucosaminyl-diphospho-decaprenol L-rhamnosyltransferase